jgi:hypothetical protein
LVCDKETSSAQGQAEISIVVYYTVGFLKVKFVEV